jgi:hypothetical protein
MTGARKMPIPMKKLHDRSSQLRIPNIVRPLISVRCNLWSSPQHPGSSLRGRPHIGCSGRPLELGLPVSRCPSTRPVEAIREGIGHRHAPLAHRSVARAACARRSVVGAGYCGRVRSASSCGSRR